MSAWRPAAAGLMLTLAGVALLALTPPAMTPKTGGTREREERSRAASAREGAPLSEEQSRLFSTEAEESGEGTAGGAKAGAANNFEGVWPAALVVSIIFATVGAVIGALGMLVLQSYVGKAAPAVGVAGQAIGAEPASIRVPIDGRVVEIIVEGESCMALTDEGKVFSWPLRDHHGFSSPGVGSRRDSLATITSATTDRSGQPVSGGERRASISSWRAAGLQRTSSAQRIDGADDGSAAGGQEAAISPPLSKDLRTPCTASESPQSTRLAASQAQPERPGAPAPFYTRALNGLRASLSPAQSSPSPPLPAHSSAEAAHGRWSNGRGPAEEKGIGDGGAQEPPSAHKEAQPAADGLGTGVAASAPEHQAGPASANRPPSTSQARNVGQLMAPIASALEHLPVVFGAASRGPSHAVGSASATHLCSSRSSKSELAGPRQYDTADEIEDEPALGC